MCRPSLRVALRLTAAACLILGGCGSKDGASPPPGDTTPPSAVTNLSATAVAPDSVRLTWTAPAHDGGLRMATRYEVRHSTAPLTEVGWAAATPVPGAPQPRPAASAETLVVRALHGGTTYHFGLKSADEVPNWSPLSNVAVVTTPIADTTPPGAVTDLEVGSPTDSSLILAWTAPGDDGATGTAVEYDIRYSKAEITAANWASATPAPGIPAPSAAGAREQLLVSGLQRETTYFFALKTRDEVPGQWSALSNSPSGTTTGLPDADNEMLPVPAGPFTMGSERGEGYDDERPEHTPTISAFSIGKYEVTNLQYAAGLNWALAQGLIAVDPGGTYGSVRQTDTNVYLLYMDDAFSPDDRCRVTYQGGVFGVTPGWKNHPVVSVTWFGAAAYCNWLSVKEGLNPCYGTLTWSCDFSANGYRLPTEAEWEKSARGSTDERSYAWGEGIDCGRCNYIFCNRSTVAVNDPVYLAGASPYGALHMTGNVREWCNDWYGKYYYASTEARGQDPQGPVEGDIRVCRGGCQGLVPMMVRCAYRDVWDRESTSLGFRVARRP